MFRNCKRVARSVSCVPNRHQSVESLECEEEDDTTVVTWTIYNPAVVLSAVYCCVTASQLLLTLPSVPAAALRCACITTVTSF